MLLYPEARAALSAAGRGGRLSAAELASAHADLEGLLERIDLIQVDAPLARAAGALAERHGLRGYDAVHLATAVALDDPHVVVITWDRDLSAAARAAGRSVAPVLT